MHISPHPSRATLNGQRGLRALVHTTDGWAVQHAVATVTDSYGRQIARAEADADGVVVTGPLEPGVYTVVVTAAGYAPIACTAIATSSGCAELGTIMLTRAGTMQLPPPGAWTIDPAHSTVAVTAHHLGLSRVRGRFGEFGGRIDIGSAVEPSTVTAEINAASIETGNRMRDEHLRSPDFLDIGRHPTIAYRGTGLSAAGPDQWTVHGRLTLRGITRPVDLDLAYLGTGPDTSGGMRAAFRAVTELRREDFAITFNQILEAGISLIGATLEVELDIQAVHGEFLPLA